MSRASRYLLNVWGTWCVTCNAELAYLTELREQGVMIVGLYYQQPVDAAFGEVFNLAALQQEVALKLEQQGNPYQWNILDKDRTLIFDLGVTGAPETFLVDAQGIIRYHHIGDINPQVWQQKLAAAYQSLAGVGHEVLFLKPAVSYQLQHRPPRL